MTEQGDLRDKDRAIGKEMQIRNWESRIRCEGCVLYFERSLFVYPAKGD